MKGRLCSRCSCYRKVDLRDYDGIEDILESASPYRRPLLAYVCTYKSEHGFHTCKYEEHEQKANDSSGAIYEGLNLRFKEGGST